MIVDECDQILQTLLVLILLLQTAGSDPELSLAGKGGGVRKFKGIRTKSNQFNVFFYHFQHIH